ncbi:hypothetical protein CR513_63125, partial [Mucuna pruriens]
MNQEVPSNPNYWPTLCRINLSFAIQSNQEWILSVDGALIQKRSEARVNLEGPDNIYRQYDHDKEDGSKRFDGQKWYQLVTRHVDGKYQTKES